MRYVAFGAVIVASSIATAFVPAFQSAAKAQDDSTVTCASRDGQYKECRAAPLRAPTLIRQLSRTPCVSEKNYGYNPASGYLWVGGGCAAVFADAQTRRQPRDPNYDRDGNYVGPHGNGALVDNPDRPSSGDPTDGAMDRCADAAIAKGRSYGSSPRVAKFIDHYPDDDGYHVEGELSLRRQDGPATMHFVCTWNGRNATVMFAS